MVAIERPKRAGYFYGYVHPSDPHQRCMMGPFQDLKTCSIPRSISPWNGPVHSGAEPTTRAQGAQHMLHLSSNLGWVQPAIFLNNHWKCYEMCDQHQTQFRLPFPGHSHIAQTLQSGFMKKWIIPRAAWPVKSALAQNPSHVGSEDVNGKPLLFTVNQLVVSWMIPWHDLKVVNSPFFGCEFSTPHRDFLPHKVQM